MLIPSERRSKLLRMISTIALSKCKFDCFIIVNKVTFITKMFCTDRVFTSVLNSYYAGFIPLCFVNRHLYFDKLWATQHLTFAFLGAFTSSLAYCFPVRYSDVLHRASLHLGKTTIVSPSSLFSLLNSLKYN